MRMMKFYTWFLVATVIITIASLIAIFTLKVNFAIDFTGGSILEIAKTDQLTTDMVREELEKQEISNTTIVSTGENTYIIRTKPVENQKKDEIIANLQSRVGEGSEVNVLRFETIGPTVSKSLIEKAIYSIIAASIAIILFIAFSFRNIPDKSLSFKFGISAIITLFHDAIVAAALFVIVSQYYFWEIDALFITALLTVMGFSVHDTIVVFDRIKENLFRYNDSFENIVNRSIQETLIRSINTSMTLLITLAALLLLGGETLRPFIFILFVGILVGTYSSIFVAAPLITGWNNLNIDWQRLINHVSYKNGSERK